MTGGTRKRGKTWSYYFDLGTINGKRQKKEKGGFKTKKEAEVALAKAINKYNMTGSVFEPSEIAAADYLDQWYKSYCVLNLKPNTIKNYKRLIDKFISPAIGKYRLCALNPAAVHLFIDQLKKDGFSKGTVTLIRDILSSALNYAIHPLGYIQYNPCQRILEVFPSGHPYHIAFMIGYYTRMRINEIFALTWDDVNFEKRTISVNKTVVRMKKQSKDDPIWQVTDPKTETSKRAIDFGSTLLLALKTTRKQKQFSRLKWGSPLIFTPSGIPTPPI